MMLETFVAWISFVVLSWRIPFDVERKIWIVSSLFLFLQPLLLLLARPQRIRMRINESVRQVIYVLYTFIYVVARISIPFAAIYSIRHVMQCRRQVYSLNRSFVIDCCDLPSDRECYVSPISCVLGMPIVDFGEQSNLIRSSNSAVRQQASKNKNKKISHYLNSGNYVCKAPLTSLVGFHHPSFTSDAYTP